MKKFQASKSQSKRFQTEAERFQHLHKIPSWHDAESLVIGLKELKLIDATNVRVRYLTFDLRRKNLHWFDSNLEITKMTKQNLIQAKIKQSRDTKSKSNTRPIVNMNGRNPFKPDPRINYEQDSEEELADMLGDRLSQLSNQDKSEQEQEEDLEEEAQSCKDDGFIISDDELSDTSNYDDDPTVMKQMKMIKRLNNQRINEQRRAMVE